MIVNILIGFVVLAIIGAGAFWFLGQKSQKGAAPGIENGMLATCPSSPNCVVSESHADEKHRIAAFGPGVWGDIPDAVREAGGEIISQGEDYIAAEFSSATFKFVDDVEFRRTDDAVHVRSASRVGYSDRGVNRARIEALRLALKQ